MDTQQHRRPLARTASSSASRQRGEQMFGDRVWCWRTAGDADVDRQHVLESADDVGRIGENVAAERAVAECGYDAGLRHRLVGREQWTDQPGGDRSGDKQDVGVSRGGDDVEAVALNVVEGIADGAELVLAAVARAGVDVAQRQRTRPSAAEVRVAADRGELT